MLKISFKADNVAQLIERYGIDFGPDGIFMRMKEPLAVGTRLRFAFRLLNNELLLEWMGTVHWRREYSAAPPVWHLAWGSALTN